MLSSQVFPNLCNMGTWIASLYKNKNQRNLTFFPFLVVNIIDEKFLPEIKLYQIYQNHNHLYFHKMKIWVLYKCKKKIPISSACVCISVHVTCLWLYFWECVNKHPIYCLYHPTSVESVSCISLFNVLLFLLHVPVFVFVCKCMYIYINISVCV